MLSFLLRMAIPAGYMPDTSGGRDGAFAITICTAGGALDTLWVDLPESSGESSSDDHFENQGCPFGCVFSQGVMPSQGSPGLMGAIADRPIHLSHRNQAQPKLPALGPPLGSRAPPSGLG